MPTATSLRRTTETSSAQAIAKVWNVLLNLKVIEEGMNCNPQQQPYLIHFQHFQPPMGWILPFFKRDIARVSSKFVVPH